MNAISNTNVIHLVRCSWCNKVGHELTSCPHWIGCIAHEREKQLRLKEMQEETYPLISDDGLAAMRGLASGLLMSLAIWILVGYLVLR